MKDDSEQPTERDGRTSDDCLSPPQSRRISIEQATKAVTLCALLAYVLGLVITNTYLYYAGVSEFELLRPRFVTTGVLALGFLASSATGMMALLEWAPSVSRFSRWWRLIEPPRVHRRL